MYTLHYAPGAASFAPHWLLIELGVEHQLVRVDLAAGEHKQPAYLKLNPNGVVPTLVVDDQPMWESAAILLCVAARHRERGLAPEVGTLEHMTYLQWMVHLTNTLQPAFIGWFYPERMAGEGGDPEAAKAAARERIEAGWGRIDAALATGEGYLAGERLLAVDFMATMLMRWSRNMPRPATDWPAIRAYVTRMKALPSFRLLYEREGLTEWA
ncbi:MAG: glutathione S-transferase family protein [Steroidobacteraceae bacterium]